MNRILVILFLLTLTGCTSNKDSVLGPPPTTTKAVLEEVMGNKTQQANKWQEDNTLPSKQALYSYNQTVGKNWITRAQYVKNESLVLYFYPKRDSIGNIRPGYAMEVPLYQKVHVIMEGE